MRGNASLMPGYVLVPGLVPVPYTANVTDNLDRGHLASRAGNGKFKVVQYNEEGP